MNKFLPYSLHIGRAVIAVRDLADASCAYQDHVWTELSRDQNVVVPCGSLFIDGTEYQINGNAEVFADGHKVLEAQ